VSSFTDRHYFALAVGLYGLCTVYSVLLWRRGFRRDNRVIYLLLFAATGVQWIAMVKRGISMARCPVNDLFGATMFVSWTLAGAYLVLGLWRKLRFLGVFASPVLLATGVFGLILSSDPRPLLDPKVGPWASVHAAIIMLAYGAFGLGAVAALMYLSQRHSLKFDKVRAVGSLLPPIQRLEMVIWWSMGVGFALLSIGLAVGAVGLHQTKGVYFLNDAKVIWSLVVWVFYLVLLLLRGRLAQTGRQLAWSAFGGFCFILLTFWGSNLMSGIHHP